MSQFNRDYYENGKEAGLSCYENYRWLPELTVPMCETIIDALGLTPSETILDFGCAKGYVVKAFRQLGFKAFGVDISDYAISCADDDARPFLHKISENGFTLEPYSWIMCKDVLEHVDEQRLVELLHKFRKTGAKLFVIVPLGNNGTYTIPEMEKDVTHRIRQPLWWWSSTIEDAGFSVAQSKFSIPGLKEHWTRTHPFGHGFIVAT